MTRRRTSRLLALPLVFGLLAAACGSDDGDSDGGGDTTPVATEASGGDEPAEEPAENEDVAEAGTEAEGDVDTEAAEATSAVSYGGDIAVGLENFLQINKQLFGEINEIGPQKLDRRPVHSIQDPERNVRRSRSLEEIPAALYGHVLCPCFANKTAVGSAAASMMGNLNRRVTQGKIDLTRRSP